MRWFIAIVLLSVISFNACSVDVEIIEDDTIGINEKSLVKKIHLDTIVNGYRVKCDDSKIVIWGKAKKINEGNPQNTNIILMNLSPLIKL